MTDDYYWMIDPERNDWILTNGRGLILARAQATPTGWSWTALIKNRMLHGQAQTMNEAINQAQARILEELSQNPHTSP